MKQITRINHVGIRVKSLDISREFYEKLGFIFIVGPIGPEPVAVMEHPCGINVNLILNAAAESLENVLMDVPVKQTGYTHMALEVTDINAIEVELTAHAIQITEGPFEISNGATLLFIRDPDGNVIEFHEPASIITSGENA